MGSWIGIIIVGLIAGFVAEKVMNRNHGLLTNLIVGVAGAFVGAFLARLVGVAAYGLIGNIIIACVGAVILLWVFDKIRSR